MSKALKLLERIKKVGIVSTNEGNRSENDMKNLKPVSKDSLLSGELADGTKFKLGIVSEKLSLRNDRDYFYAYVTLDKKRYTRSGYSGGDAGLGIDHWREMNQRFSEGKFEKWYE
jgi:hypothetical protein